MVGGDGVTADDDFSAVFERHYRDVELFLLRRAPDVQVSDLVAEVFLVAWRRWDTAPRERVLPWLYGVARHVLANEIRGRRRHRRLTERVAAHSVMPIEADHADEISDRVAVAAAFDRLSEADREVLRLVAWERLRGPECARVLGCSAAAFAWRLARARRRFRAALTQESTPNGPTEPEPAPAPSATPSIPIATTPGSGGTKS
jgi:RNA polymerase sigma factor (sigma-70 family)